MIQDTDLVGRSATVVGADTVDSAILIDIDSGYFFQLNRSAARIWDFVEEPRTFADLCEAMIAAFKAPAAICRSDVAEFVADMRKRGLLTVASS